MTPMFMLLVAWGILTGILIILLIYKSTLTMHEDDSIFLHETESQMHKDQVEVLAKMRKITPIVKVLGAISGVMILVIAGLFIYQGLTSATTLQSTELADPRVTFANPKSGELARARRLPPVGEFFFAGQNPRLEHANATSHCHCRRRSCGRSGRSAAGGGRRGCPSL
jgi:hypothetical protein